VPVRLALRLGLGSLAAALALSASAAAQEDPPPLPVPGPSIAVGKGSTALHRFDFDARTRGRSGTTADGWASFRPRTTRAFRWSIQITCLRAADNRAVFGGPATRAGRPAGGVLLFVEDNGRGGDLISRLQGFKAPPRQCPEPVMLARGALRVQGDIVVRATRGG
jgi:catechol 2,3-dioxygenase-like lactoylglutathione lyase family enzyme